MSKLDELDAAERAMTLPPWRAEQGARGPWGDGFMLNAIEPMRGRIDSQIAGLSVGDAKGLSLLRNHARALIDIARAAQRFIAREPGFLVAELEAALARLEAADA